MKLLLVDGSNMVMRAAFGGDIEPKRAVPTATGLIHRAARTVAASHLIIALDYPGEPSWRKVAFPEYKAHRTRDTAPWFIEAHAQWSRLNWHVEGVAGYEADDLIATLARRAQARAEVIICSADSDLLQLTAEGFAVLKPVNGGKFETWRAGDVCTKYQLTGAAQLRDLKALMGESGDNIPGVPGIGPVKAAKLLKLYPSLSAVIAAGVEVRCKESTLVADCRLVAERAYDLVGLKYDAPMLPLKPSDCRYAGDSLFSHHEPD